MKRLTLILWFSIGISVVAAACSGGGDSSAVPSNSSGYLGDGSTDSQNNSVDAQNNDAIVISDGSTLPADIKSLEVTPKSVVLVIKNGAPLTTSFSATGVLADGAQVTVPVTWSLDTTSLGAISANGLFTAQGELGGLVTVQAQTTDGLKATAALTVRTERQYVDPSIAAATVAQIDGAAAGLDIAPDVQYPFDETVMPQNVQAPEIQVGTYTNGVFRIRLSKPNVTVTGYVAASGSLLRWSPAASLWRSLTDSDLGAPITAKIDHWDTTKGALSAARTITINISPGAIAGAVYYWDVEQGRIMRIDPVAGTATPLKTSHPCMACHSVSRDGRYMAVDYDYTLLGSVLDLTAATPTENFVPSSDRLFTYSTFSPDSKRLLVNSITPQNGSWVDNRQMALYDPATGLQVPATGLPSNVAQPEWSPDGKTIALISNLKTTTDGFPLASYMYERGDIAVVPVTAPDTFGALKVLHDGSSLQSAPEAGSAESHPTWSPDSNSLVFGHGTAGRASVGGNPQYFAGALYLIPSAGGVPSRLDRANGGSAGTHSYWPTFSPFTTASPDGKGKYFWLAFFSYRSYGGSTHGQLWVTAIDANPAPGKDPSHPAYWLPGQNPTTLNAAAFWTAQPCRSNGTTCSSASECCSGNCLSETPGGAPTCVPPLKSSGCRESGATCGGASDCCSQLACVANSCVTVIK